MRKWRKWLKLIDPITGTTHDVADRPETLPAWLWRQVHPDMPDPALPFITRLPLAGRVSGCYACLGTQFWRSVAGEVLCVRCHPPASAVDGLP